MDHEQLKLIELDQAQRFDKLLYSFQRIDQTKNAHERERGKKEKRKKRRENMLTEFMCSIDGLCSIPQVPVANQAVVTA